MRASSRVGSDTAAPRTCCAAASNRSRCSPELTQSEGGSTMASSTTESRVARAGSTTEFDAVIVGAGFSGMYMLQSLRDRLGLSTRVFEGADGGGGTWDWDRYPRARRGSGSRG